MGVVEIRKCDVCESEQRERTEGHWSYTYSGPARCDFKNVVSNQLEFKWDILCPRCARALTDAIADIVKTFKPKPKDDL